MKFLDFFFSNPAQKKQHREIFLESLEDRTLFDASPILQFLASQMNVHTGDTGAMAPCQNCDGGQASALARGGGPDLFVTKSNGVTTVFPGDSLTYTITYVNDGNVDATNVVITEMLPVGTTFDPTNSSAGWVETSPGSGVFEFTHGTLPALSDFFDIFFAVTVDGPNVASGLDSISNTVSIADDGVGGPDMNPDNNQETEIDTLVAAPNLSITKTDGGISASAGDTVVYTINYLNIGNQGASGVVLTENLPANTSFDTGSSTPGWSETSPGIFELSVGSMAAGAMGSADFAVTIDSPLPPSTTTISNTVTIGDDGQNGFDPPSNNTATDDTPITSIFAFDIAVDKSDGDITTVAGGTVVYTVNYSNIGQTNATGVVVEENLPPGTTFDAVNSDPGWFETAPGSGTFQFNVGNLNVGDSGSVAFAVTVDNPVGAGFEVVANLVTIFDDGANGTDDNAGNNAFIEETPIDASPDLYVTKDNGVTSVRVGDIVSYVIDYGNSGDQGASGVQITETLPAGVSFDAANSTPGWVETTPGVFVFSAGTLAAGDVGSVTFAVVVDDPIAAGIDQLINNVLISDDGASGSDLDPLNDLFVETDDVDAVPDLQVSQVDGASTVTVGDSVVYTITFANVGEQGASNVVITETLPAGTAFDPVNSTAGWVETVPGSGVFEFPVGTLAAGSGANTIDFALTVNDPIAAGIDQLTASLTISDDGDNGVDPTPADNSDADVNDVTAAPNLTLLKSDGGVSTTPTGTIIYTLTYSNVGTQGASGVVITETLPANTLFDAANSTVGWVETAPGSGVFEIAIGTVPGGTTASIEFAVQVDGTPANGDLITNTASIADDGTNGADLDSLDNNASDDTPVVAAVDLVVTIDDGGISTLPNGNVTYTLSYQNAGNLDATGVFITETVPSGATFDPVNSDSGWLETVPGSGIYVFSIGALNAGDSGTVDFAVTVSSPVAAGLDALQNTATIDDDDLNGPESNDLNNTGSDTTVIDAAPDLFVTKDDSQVAVNAGESLAYTIDYGNLGSQDATGVVLTETLPAGTTFDAATSDPGWVETFAGSGIFELNVGTLLVGETRTITFAVFVDSPLDASITQIINNVTISDDGTNGADEDGNDNTDTDTNNVGSSVGLVDLAISKDNSVVATSPGNQITYTIDYVNNGTADATGVVITETLPPGSTFDNANSSPGWYELVPGSGQFFFDVGDLPVGINGTVTFSVTVNNTIAAGIDQLVNNVSIAASEIDDDASDNVASDIDGLQAAPDLYVTKDDGLTTFVAGETIVYTIVYGNDGTQDAANVILTESLPAGTTFDAANSSLGWTETAPGSGTFELAIGDLAAGSIGNVVDFAVIVDDPLTVGQVTVQNSVSIVDDGANGADINGFDNTFNDSNDLWLPPSGNFVELAVEKTDFQNSVSLGEVVIYQISYANNGNIAANNVVVTDVIPAGVVFDALGSDPGWTETAPGSGVFEFALGTLNPGQNGILTLSIAVEDAGAGIEQLSNSATISDDGSNGVDARPDNNNDVDTNSLSAAVDLYVTKDDFQSTFVGGESIVYTMTYGNRGDQDASGVVLTESLPSGATFDAVNSSPGWSETAPGSRVFTFDIGLLPADSLDNILTFAIIVDDPLDAGLANLFNSVAIADDGTSGVDANVFDNMDADNDQLFVPPGGSFIDLAINKTDAVSTVNEGDTLVYAISYVNNGNLDATGVVLTETLPTGASFDPLNSDAGWTETSAGSGIYELNVGLLSVGETRTIAFAVTVDNPLAASVTQLVNNVTIADDGANGADARSDDNAATDVDGIQRDNSGSTSSVDLFATKDDFQVTFIPNETLVYTIVYGNHGDVDASGVVLTETLPDGSTFDAANSTSGWVETSSGSGIFQFQAGTVPAGSMGHVVLFAVTVDDPLAAGISQLVNGVRITDDGASGADLNIGDNTATDIDTLFVPPPVDAVDLAVDKSDGAISVAEGGTVIYTIDYRNNGALNATGVVITEVLPTGAVFDAANSDAGWSETSPGSGVYELSVGSLASSASGSVTFAIIVDNPLSTSVSSLVNNVTIADDGSNGADARPDDNSDADVNTIDRNAPTNFIDLFVTKDDFQVTFVEGEVLAYTIVYGNNGDTDASGVVLTETVPAGARFDAASSTAGWLETSPGVYAYQAGTVPAGSAGHVVVFAIAVDDPLAGSITQLVNSVSIADDGANGGDRDVSDNSATDSNNLFVIPPGNFIDLAINKDDNSNVVMQGDTVLYTIEYANNGTLPATSVTLTETLPAGTRFDAVNSDAGWTETVPGSGIFEFDAGTLAIGETRSVTFAVTVDDPLAAGLVTLINNVSIADDGANGVDARPDNNSDSDVNSVDRGTSVPVNAVDLYVTKDDGQISFVPGESLVYVIDYGNRGDADATGVVLTELLPAGMSFDPSNSSTGWVERSAGSGIFDFAIGALAAGSNGNVVTFAVTIDDPLAAGVNQLVNTAVIADDGANGDDFNTSDNAVTDINDLYVPPVGNHVDLTIDKSDAVTIARAGDRLVFTIAYANNGTISANGVVIRETLAAGTTFDTANSTPGWTETVAGSGIFELNVGALAAGETRTVDFAVVVDDPLAANINVLVNQIAISDDGASGVDARPDDNDDTDVNTVDRQTGANAVDLFVTKDDSQVTFTDGEVLLYTVLYGNNGTADATGVVLVETLPSGTNFNAAASSPGWLETSPGSGVFEYQAGTLPSGTVDQVVLFAVTVHDPLASGITQLVNFVSIADDGNQGVDADTSDNSAGDTNNLYLPPGSNHVDLSLTKTDGVTAVVEGDSVTYAIEYANHGTVVATGVVITETLPAGTTFDVSNSTSGWTETAAGSGIFEFSAGVVAPGETRTITFAVIVDDPAAASITSLVNNVSITDDGASGADARPDDNTYTDINSLDRDNTSPVGQVDLYVTKDDGRVTFTAGESLVYAIRYGNLGDIVARSVVLTEVLPAGTSFDALNSTAGWTETSAGSGIFELNAGDIVAGAADQLALFAITIDDPLAASITQLANSVLIRDDGSNGDDFDTSDNADTDVNTRFVAPSGDFVDLGISKSDNEVVVFEGDSLIYTIDYANNGTLDATGVVITESLPAGTVFDSGNSTTGWTETSPGSGIFVFSAGTVLAGESRTITFAVIVDNPLAASITELSNSATIADDNANGADARPDDNAAQDVNVVDSSGTGTGGVDLYVQKTDNGSTFLPGESLIYELRYGNWGSVDSTNVVITEVIPAGTSFDPINSSPGWTESSPGSGIFTYQVGSLAALDVGNLILFAVRIDNPLASGITQLVNSVTITDDGVAGADADPSDNSATDSNALYSPPANDHVDLAIEISDSQLFVGEGDQIVYSITYTNQGTLAASGVTIQQFVPIGTSFSASGSSAGWTQPNAGLSVFEFDAGTVQPGEARTITFAVNVDDPLSSILTEIINRISITDDSANGPESRVDNNSDSDVNFVVDNNAGNNATVDLFVNADDSQATFVSGETLVYTIIYGNNGDADANGASIQESLPAGTSFDPGNSSSGWVETFPGSRVFVLDIGNVAAGLQDQVAVFAITVDDPLAAGISQVVNSVVITDNGANGSDGDATNNAASDANNLFTPPAQAHVDLRVDKTDNSTSVAAGDTVVYIIDYANNGTQDATGVVITETLAAGVSFDAANSTAGWMETTPGSGVFQFAAGTVAAGETRTIIFSVTINDPLSTGSGLLVNTVTIADDAGNGADARPDDNSDSDTNTVAGFGGGGNNGGGNNGGGGNPGGGNTGFVDYVITKDDGLTLVTPGETVSYTLTVENIGTGNGSGVQVSDNFTLGIFATVVADNGGVVDLANGTIQWDLGGLAAGDSIILTVTAQLADSVAAGITQYSNSVQVTDDGALGADVDPTNNAASDTNTVDAAPDLAITKTQDRQFPFVGGFLVYSLTYTNVGTQDATGVVVTESLPPGTVFNAFHSSQGWNDLGNGQFEFAAGSLTVGESRTIRFAVQIVDEITSIENQATIVDDGANGGEPNQANNSSTSASGVDPFDRETIGKRYYLASTASGIYQTLVDPPAAANGIRMSRLAEFIDGHADIVEREVNRLNAPAAQATTIAPAAPGPQTELASASEDEDTPAEFSELASRFQSRLASRLESAVRENSTEFTPQQTSQVPQGIPSRWTSLLSSSQVSPDDTAELPDANVRVVQPLSNEEVAASTHSTRQRSENTTREAQSATEPESKRLPAATPTELRRWARWRAWFTKNKSA